MATNPEESDIISPFEGARQAAIRGVRRESRDDPGIIVGYVSTDGQPLALTGDEEAPYIKIINSSLEPIPVTISGTIIATVDLGAVVADRYVGSAAQTPGDDPVPSYDINGRLLVADLYPILRNQLIPNAPTVPMLLALAGAGYLHEAFGGNGTGATVYAQLFDLGAGPGAVVPFASIEVPTANTFSFDFSKRPLEVANGIVLALSSTRTVYTALGASSDYTLNVRYNG